MTAAVEQAAQEAVRAAAARIGARLGDVAGVSVTVDGDAVTVRGRGLSRKRIEEPALRRLLVEEPAWRRLLVEEPAWRRPGGIA